MTEGAFLRVTKPDLTTEDFVGNSYEMEVLGTSGIFAWRKKLWNDPVHYSV